MPYCSKCGVEVDNHLDDCPLCSAPIQKFDETASSGKYPPRYLKRIRSNKEIRTLTWHIISLVLIISFLSVLSIDLVINHRMVWAGYPMTGIGVTWLMITFILLFARKPLVIIIGNTVSVLLCLVLLDIFDGSLNWFLQLGLPITSMVFVVTLVTYILIKYLKNPGSNVAGILILMIGVLCVGLEMLISAFVSSFHVKWSFIVLAVLIPLGTFLIVYHYAFRKKYDVTKIFHL